MSNFYSTEVRLAHMTTTMVSYNSESRVTNITLNKLVEEDEVMTHIRTDLILPYHVLKEAFELATLARERVLASGKDIEFFWPRELLANAV